MYEYETKEAWEERNKLRPRKRKKWRLFHKTSMILFLLGLLLGLGLISGCAPPAGEWWFSTVAPAERERQYHIGFAFDSPSLHIEDHDECTVTVIMEPTPDAQGLTWRIIDAPEQCDTSSTLGLWMWWIQLMQNAKERGTGVTATEVHFGDWPLLAGPLRKGDRMQMTFGMFAIFSVRAEVLSADAEEVAVRFDFVGAWAAYRWKGSGDLNMAVDDEGLREVRGSWGGTFGTHDFDARLTIDRLPQVKHAGLSSARPTRRWHTHALLKSSGTPSSRWSQGRSVGG